MTTSIQLIPVPGIAEILPGDDLARTILAAAGSIGLNLCEDDVIIIAQKIVSKSENRLVDLRTIEPTPQAVEIAALQGRDPALSKQFYQNRPR